MVTIQIPDFYHLIPIKDLTQSAMNKKIQLIGQIVELTDDRITINDETAKTSLFVKQGEFKIGMVIRIFGIWNGIELKIQNTLIWTGFPPDKIALILR